MSPVALLDEMVRRLQEEERINPGADLNRAEQIVCEVVRDAAVADRDAAQQASRLAARVLGHGIHDRPHRCDACGAPSMTTRCAECVEAVRMDGEDMMGVAS